MPSLNTKLASAPNTQTNYVLKATSSTTIGNSLIFDNGTFVGINTTNPSYQIDVAGAGRFTTGLYFNNSATNGAVVWQSANESLRFATNDTERIRITGAGNVGIGVSSPVGKLDINTGGNTNIVISNDSVDTGYNIISLNGTRTKGSYAGIAGGGTGDNNLYLNSGNNIVFQTGASYTARMAITSSGNVGIGTSSPVTFTNYNTLSVNGSTGGAVVTMSNGTSALRMACGTTDSALWEPRNVDFAIGTNNTERMRILSNGRIGINSTTSDGEYLFINTKTTTTYNPNAWNGANAQIGLTNGSGSNGAYSGIRFTGGGATEGFFGVVQNGTLAEFVWQNYNGTSYGERMRMDSNGQFTIRTSGVNPITLSGSNHQYLLISSLTGYESMTQYYNPTANNWFTGIRTSAGLAGTSGYHIYSSLYGNDVMGLYANGNYDFAGSDVSDRRLKENIEAISYNALEKINALEACSYNMINNPNVKRHGFIAQEVQKVLPDLINGEEKEDEYLGLDYNGLLAIAIKAIQEQQAQIEELKALINK